MCQSSSTTDQPGRWVVAVSVTDPRSGAKITGPEQECRDIHHARTLLTELRELTAELSRYLPGLSVEGYEVGETFHLTSEGQTALATLAKEAASGHAHNARWWAAAMEQVK